MSSLVKRSDERYDDGHAREEPRGLVADRVQQVRLAESDPAVDEERVVGLGRQLGDRLAGGLGELVGRADDEGVEGVARVEALDRSRRRPAGPSGGGGASSDGASESSTTIVTRGLAAEHVGGGALERVEVVLHQPVARERGWARRSRRWSPSRARRRQGRNQVSMTAGGSLREAASRMRAPKAIQHRTRPHLHTELSTACG